MDVFQNLYGQKNDSLAIILHEVRCAYVGHMASSSGRYALDCNEPPLADAKHQYCLVVEAGLPGLETGNVGKDSLGDLSGWMTMMG